MEEVESIERATLAAVPPQALEEHAGWLLPFDDGTVGRSHSATPLNHAPLAGADAQAIAQRYRERAHRPMFRIPDVAAFESLQADLQSRGFAADRPTLVQVAGTLAGLSQLAPDATTHLAATPEPGWADVFLGEGFDPVSGASRLAILRRARDSVFASIARDGRVVAVGSACFSHGWCGIHGMRTAATHRGRGYAASILAALAHEAAQRGIGRAFLQVEEANVTAQSLYRRAGFTTRWRYRYWAGAQL